MQWRVTAGYAHAVKFVQAPAELSDTHRRQIDRLERADEALQRRISNQRPTSDYAQVRTGLLSLDGRPETALPVAVCGEKTPNRIVFIGDTEKNLSPAALIAGQMGAQGVCVIVADAPVTAEDTTRLAALSLADDPKRVILLDPNDTAGLIIRNIFSDRVNERNHEPKTSVGFAVVGKGELAPYHDGGNGPRTVRVTIGCLTDVLDGIQSPAPASDAAAGPSPRRSAVPGPGASGAVTTTRGQRSRRGTGM